MFTSALFQLPSSVLAGFLACWWWTGGAVQMWGSLSCLHCNPGLQHPCLQHALGRLPCPHCPRCTAPVPHCTATNHCTAPLPYRATRTAGEYIDDTEDLVNIQLDYARNKLIRFEVVLTTGTFALAFMSCVAGILGENLVLPSAITGVRRVAHT